MFIFNLFNLKIILHDATFMSPSYFIIENKINSTACLKTKITHKILIIQEK